MVVAVRREQARLDAVLHEAVGEVDARGSHVYDAALTAGAWLRQVARLTPAEATGLVRTARALRSGTLPATRAALAAGDISADHARVIARGVTDAPAGAVALIEPEALHAALTADVRATAAVMRAFTHALDPDGADAAALARYHRAGLTLTPTLDGSMAITGTADEVTGATIATAVDLASPLTTDDNRTAARRRLDGLADICRRYLADPDAPRRGGGGHAHLIVTLDHHTLRDQPPTSAEPQPATETEAGTAADDEPPAEDGPAADADADPAAEPARPAGSPGGTLSWIGRIAGSTARRAGCDSLATFITIGPDGQILEAGTTRRYFTAAQRRAMIGRDGDRCFTPWCDRPITWADAHHLVPVSQNGPTTVENGAIPCDGHHTMLHEGHWQAIRLPDGRYHLHHPTTGRTIGPEDHPPGHNRPPPHRRE
jgi:hypothetical protein